MVSALACNVRGPGSSPGAGYNFSLLMLGLVFVCLFVSNNDFISY